MADDRFLKQAYRLKTTDDTLDLYQGWADSYEATLREHGYVTPQRCADALSRHLDNKDSLILDIGCGTGLSGVALNKAGFHNVDGTDLSEAMLEKASLHKGVYNSLQQISLDNPFPFDKGAYAAITAMGVIADKHAPPETISQIISKLETGGLFVFSLNNHTLENPAYEVEIEGLISQERAALREAEIGPHMTEYNMTSKICVLQAL